MFNIFNKNKLSKEEKQFNQQFSSGADDIILSKNLRKDLNNKNLNNNICIIGQAGTGKGRNYIIPNLLQANSSFVIFEEHSHEYNKIADFLKQEKGYNIQVFDLQNPENSIYYNPLSFIKDEDDINRIIDCLYTNIDIKEKDDFLNDTEKMLLKFIILYLIEKKEHLTFPTIIKYLEIIGNSNEEFFRFFEDIETTITNRSCLNLAKIIKTLPQASKSITAVAIICKIHPFVTGEITKIINDTTLNINALIESKSAIFIVAPIFKEYFKPIVAMLYSEIFKHLHQTIKPNNKPTHHIQFIMDDFVNMCYFSNFNQLMAGSRIKNIDFTILLQSISQLKAKLPDTWKIILDCCDIKIFLGASSHETLDYFCNLIKQNITINDLKTMNMSDCIVFTHKTSGILCDKYILEEHPDYQNVIKVNS